VAELGTNSEKKLMDGPSFSLGGDSARAVNVPQVKERFDDMEFLRSHCKKGDTIFICGPPVMNTTIYKNLKELGFPDHDVYLI
jgi:NAD(P)H-flavin reductase